MANNYFDFKRFRVYHELCAMKVGTDGVLLGAWAMGGGRVLDVGTGSGLIALFMAQRYPEARITAIDIDRGAYQQAQANVLSSPFNGRIEVMQSALQDFQAGVFDAIVCNPPFFQHDLRCPDPHRTVARHATLLTAQDLMHHSARLLSVGGELSIIIPAGLCSEYYTEALIAGLAPSRAYFIRTVASKSVSRCLLAYRKGHTSDVEELQVCLKDEGGKPSAWYKKLTANFYLNNV